MESSQAQQKAGRISSVVLAALAAFAVPTLLGSAAYYIYGRRRRREESGGEQGLDDIYGRRRRRDESGEQELDDRDTIRINKDTRPDGDRIDHNPPVDLDTALRMVGLGTVRAGSSKQKSSAPGLDSRTITTHSTSQHGHDRSFTATSSPPSTPTVAAGPSTEKPLARPAPTPGVLVGGAGDVNTLCPTCAHMAGINIGGGGAACAGGASTSSSSSSGSCGTENATSSAIGDESCGGGAASSGGRGAASSGGGCGSAASSAGCGGSVPSPGSGCGTGGSSSGCGGGSFSDPTSSRGRAALATGVEVEGGAIHLHEDVLMEEDIVMHEQELLFAIDDDLSRQASNAVKLSPAISNLSPPAGDATPSRRSNQSRRSKPSFSTSRTIEGGRGSRGANRQVGIGVEHYPVVDEETGAKADDVVEVRYVSEAEEKRRYFAAWDDDDDDFLGGFSLVGGGTNSTTTSPGIDHQHRDHEEHYLEAGSPILAPPSGGMVMEDLEDLF